MTSHHVGGEGTAFGQVALDIQQLMSEHRAVDSGAMRAVWEEHCRCEFELRDVDATLETMTDDPHLLNIPTGHGGRGRDGMRRFYTEEFIGTLPDDVAIESLGIAVGNTRLAEEVLLTFTHDRRMPWILDGIEPTG